MLYAYLGFFVEGHQKGVWNIPLLGQGGNLLLISLPAPPYDPLSVVNEYGRERTYPFCIRPRCLSERTLVYRSHRCPAQDRGLANPRPHRSLGFLTPKGFRLAGKRGYGKDGRPVTLGISSNFPLPYSHNL